MWIVKNLLRGTLRFPGLDISIPPKEEFDLDVLPREVTENSNQIIVAFEEGYLQNIRKEALTTDVSPPEKTELTVDDISSQDFRGISDEDLERTLTKFKNNIIEEIKNSLPPIPDKNDEDQTLIDKISQLRESFVGDVENLLTSVEKAKEKIREEKSKILEDDALSGMEIRARLKFLEEKEAEISKNFDRLGVKSSNQEQPPQGKGLMEKADILSDL